MKKNEFRKELVLILVLLCTTIAYAQKMIRHLWLLLLIAQRK